MSTFPIFSCKGNIAGELDVKVRQKTRSEPEKTHPLTSQKKQDMLKEKQNMKRNENQNIIRPNQISVADRFTATTEPRRLVATAASANDMLHALKFLIFLKEFS